jgi:colicin import membrane protein
VQFGLVISIILHAAILGWALFTIQSQRELRVAEPEPIVTDLITEGELTKLRKGVRTAKQLEAEAKESPKADLAKKEAPKLKVAAAPPPPPSPPEPPASPVEQKADPIAEKLASLTPPPPQPKAAPSPPAEEQQKQAELAMIQEQARQAEEQRKRDELRREEERKLEEQGQAEENRLAEERRKLEEERRRVEEEKRRLEEQRKQAELKRKTEEEKKRKEAAAKKKREEEERKRREAEAKRKFDAEKIAALLNKVPNSSAPPPSSEPLAPTKAKGPALGAPEGRDNQISASELAMLGQIIRSCVQPRWNVLSGGASAQDTLVKIRLRFNPDGRLLQPPEIMNPQRTPYFVAISESAVRAVQECEPFNLPPAKYQAWKDIVVNFQPRDMY